MDALALAAEFLREAGPWGLVVFLGWAYWRKDRDNRDLAMQIVKLVEANSASFTKLESTITNLKDFVITFIKPPGG